MEIAPSFQNIRTGAGALRAAGPLTDCTFGGGVIRNGAVLQAVMLHARVATIRDSLITPPDELLLPFNEQRFSFGKNLVGRIAWRHGIELSVPDHLVLALPVAQHQL